MKQVAGGGALVLVLASVSLPQPPATARFQPPQLPPIAARPAVYDQLFDQRQLTIQVTAQWTKFTETLPRHEFLRDHTRWLRMHFDDWDALPDDIRRAGLARLEARYGAVVHDAGAWPTMTPDDWDAVPQPIRAMAAIEMIEHWAAVYQPGDRFGLDAALVLRTIKAIALSESWLDHRAVHVNDDGTADVGIGAASEYARAAVRRGFVEGWCDFALDEQDYFDPWHASRWVVFWFGLMLSEANGDLDLAVRAYNWGIGQARADAGNAYLDTVLRRRARYFEGPSGSPTWRELSQWRRAARTAPR